MDTGGGSIMALSPSFSSYSSTRFAEIAAKISEEFSEQREELGLEGSIFDSEFAISAQNVEEKEKLNGIREDEEEEEEEEEFEFAFVNETSPISADEIFYNGQIKPIYPVFNRNLLFAGCNDEGDEERVPEKKNASNVRFPLRKLLIQERDPPSSSSSEADEIDSLPAGSYCVWTPKSVQASPEMAKKSNSTGSSKRWRFRDFLPRSNSDGKDTFVFLANSNTASAKPKKKDERRDSFEKSESVKVAGKVKGKGVSGEKTGASAHEVHYIRNRALKEGDRRRSYLPYRQDLVGLFANVNGVSRSLHPF